MISLFENKWDSDFFNFKTGTLKIEGSVTKDELDSYLFDASKKYRLVYLVSDYNNIELLGRFRNNCSYIDDRIIFSRVIDEDVDIHENIIEFSSETIIPNLYKLAFESGKFSRFNMDEVFPDDKFKGLYSKMIDNTINLKYADKIYIYDKELYKGFITVKVKDFVQIGLIGVDPEYQGLGIGKELIKAAEKFCFQSGLSRVNVLTQAINFGAVKFYKNCGYSQIQRDYIYHIWF